MLQYVQICLFSLLILDHSKDIAIGRHQSSAFVTEWIRPDLQRNHLFQWNLHNNPDVYINANINNFFYASFPYALLGHFLLDKLYHILNT